MAGVDVARSRCVVTVLACCDASLSSESLTTLAPSLCSGLVIIELELCRRCRLSLRSRTACAHAPGLDCGQYDDPRRSSDNSLVLSLVEIFR